MELNALSLDQFIEKISSMAPAPGGGSVSGYAGAMGAALLAMVAGLTLGREKYKEHEDLAKEILEKTSGLTASLLNAVEEDARAYGAVSEAFALPKSTDAEKAERSIAVERALKEAVRPPLDVMQLCRAALESAEKMVGRSNVNAASDLGVAALNLKAAVQGAWLNVLTNLASLDDKAFADDCRQRGAGIVEYCEGAADRIYNKVQQGLKG